MLVGIGWRSDAGYPPLFIWALAVLFPVLVLYLGSLVGEGNSKLSPRMQLADSINKRAFMCIYLRAACIEIIYAKLIPQARETSTRLPSVGTRCPVNVSRARAIP